MGKHHTATFKAHLVRELLREDKTISQIATAHGIHPNQLSKWKAVALQGLPGLFERRDATSVLQAAHAQQITDLYAEIGRLTTHVAWLKKNRWRAKVLGARASRPSSRWTRDGRDARAPRSISPDLPRANESPATNRPRLVL